MIARVRLHFFGRVRCIGGGPFDAFQPPAIGLCLDVGSRAAGRATVMLPVADFGAPTPDAFADGLARLLRAMRAAPGLPAYIGCRAGLGRTGMAIAALAKLAGESDPLAWTRRHYDPRAIETAAQEQAVRDLDAGAVWRQLAADQR